MTIISGDQLCSLLAASIWYGKMLHQYFSCQFRILLVYDSNGLKV